LKPSNDEYRTRFDALSNEQKENILADTKELMVYIKKRENKNRSLNILKSFCQIEDFLTTVINNEKQNFHIKELNEQAEEHGCRNSNPDKIRIILNFWAIKNYVNQHIPEYSKDHATIICLQERDLFNEKISKRHELAQFIVEYLYDKCNQNVENGDLLKEEIPVDFSILELKEEFENRIVLFRKKTTLDEIEDALFYLSRINALYR